MTSNNKHNEIPKRLTINVDDSLEVFKKSLEEELGFQLSYSEAIRYLVKFYRKNQTPKTQWR